MSTDNEKRAALAQKQNEARAALQAEKLAAMEKNQAAHRAKMQKIQADTKVRGPVQMSASAADGFKNHDRRADNNKPLVDLFKKAQNSVAAKSNMKAAVEKKQEQKQDVTHSKRLGR